MQLRLAAFAALVAVAIVAFPTHAADRLTLDDAFARVAANHPDLRLFGLAGTCWPPSANAPPCSRRWSSARL